MKVIYAGFSKCGTKTIAEALRLLDYEVYDFLENYEFLGDQWMKIFEEGCTSEMLYEMYKDVDAVTDMPCFFFWDELLKAFPDAKIVFSQRSNEDVWWKSFLGQLDAGEGLTLKLMSVLSPTYYKMHCFGSKMFQTVFGYDVKYGVFTKTTVNETLMRKTYRSHNAYVLNCAPKDQLLVFDLKQGWEPLCKFLGKPVPVDKAFPHKNKKGSINQEMLETAPIFQRIKRETMVTSLLYSCGTAYIVYKLIRDRSAVAGWLSDKLEKIKNF